MFAVPTLQESDQTGKRANKIMKPFVSGHGDLISDVAYDFYGKRLATSSADKYVRVFDKNDAGEWELNDHWRAHDSSVIKVCWAGPEYGQVIATASHDATIKIFEEDSHESLNSGKRWKRKHTLSDFKGPLYDIEFAPSHLGLKLASIGSDGVLRIHEVLDPNSMGFWSLVSEVNLLTTPVARQLQSSFALSWCPSVFFTEYLAVCALEDATIYKKDGLGKFVEAARFPDHKGLIRDIAWAPSMGRGFQLVATASKDGKVRIFKVTAETHEPGDDDDSVIGDGDPTTKIVIKQLHEFGDHQGEVWRVSWNLTGTILASAGDDGKVRFWKASYGDNFQCMAVVTAEQRADSDESAIED